MDNWFARWFVKTVALWLLILIPTMFVLDLAGASQGVQSLVVLFLFVVMVLVALRLYDKVRPHSP